MSHSHIAFVSAGWLADLNFERKGMSHGWLLLGRDVHTIWQSIRERFASTYRRSFSPEDAGCFPWLIEIGVVLLLLDVCHIRGRCGAARKYLPLSRVS